MTKIDMKVERLSLFESDRIPIIVGPTAVGKTEYSLKLAEENGATIVSADSMQVYRGMDIGTAKTSLSDRQKIPHLLIDIINPDQPWTLYHFLETVKPLLESNVNLMIVGGTGLYIRALVQGFRMPNSTTDPEYRQSLSDRIVREGLPSVYEELLMKDPQSASVIKGNDKFRIMRAMEMMDQTGMKPSEIKQEGALMQQFHVVVLNRPRDVLYRRINSRVEDMLRLGLVDEVKGLLQLGYDPALSSLQGIGYKEVVSHLKGRLGWEDMVELIKKRTRHFAKRQLTWYRSFANAQWIDLPED